MIVAYREKLARIVLELIDYSICIAKWFDMTHGVAADETLVKVRVRLTGPRPFRFHFLILNFQSHFSSTLGSTLIL